MRYGNLLDRLVLLDGNGLALDVENASSGRFGVDPQAIYGEWEAFVQWARTASWDRAFPFLPSDLRAPVPTPRQLFAVGLNYNLHTSESGVRRDEHLPVFTKFVSSITGPVSSVLHPGGSTDWEVELVVVIGRQGRKIARDDAWGYVAGLTAGQDLSERDLQKVGAMPQFSLGKSYPGFCPMGPWVVTPDELPDPDDLAVETRVNGTIYQRARTSEMIMSVSALIEYLSAVVTLLPGDVIYTGTPAGVGEFQQPPLFLKPGDIIETYIEGIGELRTTMIGAHA